MEGEAVEVAGAFPGVTPWLSACLHSCDLANGPDAKERQGKECFSLWYWLSKSHRRCANSEKSFWGVSCHASQWVLYTLREQPGWEGWDNHYIVTFWSTLYFKVEVCIWKWEHKDQSEKKCCFIWNETSNGKKDKAIMKYFPLQYEQPASAHVLHKALMADPHPTEMNSRFPYRMFLVSSCCDCRIYLYISCNR